MAAKGASTAGAKATKAAPKTKAATAKASKESTAATPKKAASRKRTADALEEESKPAHIDAPAKQAKKDGARKAKAKAKEAKEEAVEATVEESKPATIDAPVAQAKKDGARKAKAKAKEDAGAKAVETETAAPKAKKAKTTKASETAATKAEEKETKPAKAAPKKKAEPKKTPATPKSPAKKETESNGTATKAKKRKATTIEGAEEKAKAAVSSAAKKQKISEETAEEATSLLGLVGTTLQGVTKRMSGLFTVLSGNEETNGTPAPKKKAAPKRSSKAKATPSGEDNAAGEETGALELADSDLEIQDDDPAAAFLRGFESSDEEAASGDEGFAPGKPMPKLPKKKGLASKLKGAAAEKGEPGVVYIGRIPHGFHENEMRAYFSQFGEVEHVRLSRSKKTGASKHYAFLQFASVEVARIAAETMNNYLMFGHILKCHVIPAKQVHPKLWVGADRRFQAVPWNKIQGRKLAEPKGRTEWQEKIDAEEKRRATKAAKLQAIGYDFTAPPLKSAGAVPARPKKTKTATVAQDTSIVTTADNATIVEVSATEVAPAAEPQLALPAASASAEATAAQDAVDNAVTAKKRTSKKSAKAKA